MDGTLAQKALTSISFSNQLIVIKRMANYLPDQEKRVKTQLLTKVASIQLEGLTLKHQRKNLTLPLAVALIGFSRKTNLKRRCSISPTKKKKERLQTFNLTFRDKE